jgi:LPS export ABC transporter protein LptC
MANWQRRARLLVAVVAVAVAVAVALAYKGRPAQPADSAPPATAPADPNALIQAAVAVMSRLNKDREEVRIHYAELRSYPDGSATMNGVKVVTQRAGGRTFTIMADKADVASGETSYDLIGNVRVAASDGMMVRTEHATYNENDGIVRAPGPVTFARGRLTGSGIGFSYDKEADSIHILDGVIVKAEPSGNDGGSALDITAPTVELHRTAHVIRFPRGMRATRGREVVSADAAVGRLSAGEDRLETVELRGNARVQGAPGAAGGLESLTGRDMDLRYGPDGQQVEQAVVVGEAVMQLAGQRSGTGGRIAASTLDVTLAPDGSTPTALAGRQQVALALPAEANAPARSVRAETLDARGEAGKGLTRATFDGNVQFFERGEGIDRSARSQRLDVALAPGLATINDATFARGVRFTDDDLEATAALGEYDMRQGTLRLSGSEVGAPVPRVVTDRLAVNAVEIDIALAGPVVQARRTVESQLNPAKERGRDGSETKLPSMLKHDQPVIITAADLLYDGPSQRATYTGSPQLLQGETAIKAATLVLDGKAGDLTASGGVTTTVMLEQTDEQRRTQRVRTTATAKDLKYEENVRRATYTGDAHMIGSQGDMTATRIELYFLPSGDELDTLEAHENVILKDKTRKTTGAHMKYFGADERYEVTGTPVTIVDECGRESTGRTLTLFKATDRIVLNGDEMRTQTRGASTCR